MRTQAHLPLRTAQTSDAFDSRDCAFYSLFMLDVICRTPPSVSYVSAADDFLRLPLPSLSGPCGKKVNMVLNVHRNHKAY